MKACKMPAIVGLLLMALAIVPHLAYADQVIAGDLIVQGSACVGLDCVNNENFGFDTIRLKENNLRIKFEDTSSTGAFPTTDWQIIINDSNNGGRSYFGIDNVTSGNAVLRIYDGIGAGIVIGEGSTDSGANTLSIGSATSLRRITNLAAGVDPTDAVTYQQLVDSVGSPGQVAALQTSVNTLNGQVSQNMTDITDLQGRMGTAEGNITDLQGRMGSAEGDINDLQGRMGAAEGDITDLGARLGQAETTVEALDGRVGATEADIAALQSQSRGLAVTGVNGDMADAAVDGDGGTALGAGASARGRDTAIGFQSTVTADGSVAVGANSNVQAANSVAVGADARVEEGAEGSVALGQNSVADEAGTVSVGNADSQRRITHVAAGTTATDAVNLEQLQAVRQDLQGNLDRVTGRVNRLEDRADQIGTLAAAFSALVPNARSQGNSQISLGLGC